MSMDEQRLTRLRANCDELTTKIRSVARELCEFEQIGNMVQVPREAHDAVFRQLLSVGDLVALIPQAAELVLLLDGYHNDQANAAMAMAVAETTGGL